MKKIYYILLLFINPSFSQYTVTKVIGNVKKKVTGEVLKPGSTLNENDKLLWSSQNDLVRTIVAGKGIFIISPSPKAHKAGNNLEEIVQFTLHLKSKEFNLSGRGGVFESLPDALQTEEKINKKNLIEPVNKYVFDIKRYNISAGSKFFLQIEKPGMAPIIIRLRTISDTLLIYSSDFLTDNKGFAKDTKYLLGYFSKDDNSSTNVIEIRPYFDTTSEMATIERLIIAKNKQFEREKLKQLCYSEVYEALGKPSDIIFENEFNGLVSSLKL